MARRKISTETSESLEINELVDNDEVALVTEEPGQKEQISLENEPEIIQEPEPLQKDVKEEKTQVQPRELKCPKSVRKTDERESKYKLRFVR
jgi:hypothetical protein